MISQLQVNAHDNEELGYPMALLKILNMKRLVATNLTV
jgi:hypothetical protein